MGVVNVAWRKAMASMGRYFTKDEQANGWPETLRHFQLAELQYRSSDATTMKLVRARAWALRSSTSVKARAAKKLSRM